LAQNINPPLLRDAIEVKLSKYQETIGKPVLDSAWLALENDIFPFLLPRIEGGLPLLIWTADEFRVVRTAGCNSGAVKTAKGTLQAAFRYEWGKLPQSSDLREAVKSLEQEILRGPATEKQLGKLVTSRVPEAGKEGQA